MNGSSSINMVECVAERLAYWRALRSRFRMCDYYLRDLSRGRLWRLPSPVLPAEDVSLNVLLLFVSVVSAWSTGPAAKGKHAILTPSSPSRDAPGAPICGGRKTVWVVFFFFFLCQKYYKKNSLGLLLWCHFERLRKILCWPVFLSMFFTSLYLGMLH